MTSFRPAKSGRRGRARRAAVLLGTALALAGPGELTAQWLTPGWAADAAPASPPPAAALLPPLAAAPEPPPLDGGAVALQLLGGVAGGALGTLALAAALSPFTGDAEFETLTRLAAGVLIGYPPGAAGGVFLVGNRGAQRGSFLATLAGAAGGAAVALPLVNATRGVSFLALVPVGATVGFTLSRRPAPAPPPAAAGTGPGRGERLH